MKIAYLTQSYPPMVSGAALVVEGLAKAMAKCGHRVLVIAASDQSRSYIVQEGKLTVLRLKSLHNPLRVGQRFLLYPRRSVMKTLQEFQPEVIHAHEPLQVGWLGLEYATRANIPITLTIHQIPSFIASYLPNFLRGRTEAMLWMYARWLSRKFTSMITPTKTISMLMTKMTGLQATTIGYGVDPQIFRPLLPCDDEAAIRQKWDLPLHVPLLLHVGRLDVDKCVDRVIQAAALAMAQTDTHLLIVGDGTQKPALIKLCHSLGIADRVHFPGYVSMTGGLPELYRTANLFITASEIETQGIVLLEAAASGLPLVAVRATCIPEIVHAGRNGYLAECGDIYGLGNAVSVLLKDPRKAISMGKASRALAEEHKFNFTVDTHEQLYRQMIMERRTQRLDAVRHNFWEYVKGWRLF